MKNTKPIILFIAVLSISGCVSSSPWDGIPSSERQAWLSMNINAYDARYLISNGFSPNDIQPWVQYGIKGSRVIVDWHRAGFTAKQTSKWLQKGLTLSEAKDLTN